MSDKKIAEVLLPLPFKETFSYVIEQPNINVGQIVEASFRRRTLIGVITAIKKYKKQTFNLKPINKCLDLPKIKKETLSFLEKVAAYNVNMTGNILKMLLIDKKALLNTEKYLNFQKHENHNKKIPGIKLNDTQTEIEKNIYEKVADGFSVSLLNGVTGSGKTEVYLDIAQKLIEQNGQVLILLPEIVLTAQLLERFKNRLKNCTIAQWHSSLTPKNRYTIWHGISRGKIQIILGARSALFLPFANLKLIVVDEEHDSSLKQEEGVIYNARDMAILRAKEESMPVILSSATPSLESYFNAINGKYSIYDLPSRYSGVMMPEVKIIDLNKDKTNSKEWVSLPLRKELKNTIDAGKQSLLFLNRRGYAPLVLCNDCKHKFSCPDCQFWLVEHRTKNIMQCHYCGYTQDIITQCTECGSENKLVSIGPGVERIEEEVMSFLPNARIATLTSDTIKNFKEAEKIISAIENYEIDIIIGTQMLAKGLHFKKLHMVGVIEADTGYFSGDIRILERTYQLLYQVAGRAGRENEKGLVLLQAYEPRNLVLQNLIKQDYEGFIKSEIKDRERRMMPPFSKFSIIKGSSENEYELELYMRKLMKYSPKIPDVEIFGPSPAPISKLRKKFRYRIIIKSKKTIKIQKIIRQWIDKLPYSSHVKIKIDIDPYNFM